MEIIAGLVTALNCGLAGVIGVRLLRLGADWKGPERWLGGYFLCAPLLATLLAGLVYMSFADPGRALPDWWLRPLHALDIGLASAGLFGVYVFTWLTFRPEETWARGLAIAGGVVLAASWVAFGLLEHFAVKVLNGPAYWTGFAAREGALIWMALESFHYWSLLRRRLRLGLADPLVTNRFLLWGVWALILTALGASDPIARVWYWAITGTATLWHPEVGRPIVVVMMASTSAFGVAAAASLFLTFFPTPAYRRWVATRHAPAARA